MQVKELVGRGQLQGAGFGWVQVVRQLIYSFMVSCVSHLTVSR